MFVVQDGAGHAVLVNEIAPRVHNSGHWTIDGASVSQFEQHIRAVAGWPLGKPIRRGRVEMTNLLGDEVNDVARWLATPGAAVHLYGKTAVRARPQDGPRDAGVPRVSGARFAIPSSCSGIVTRLLGRELRMGAASMRLLALLAALGLSLSGCGPADSTSGRVPAAASRRRSVKSFVDAFLRRTGSHFAGKRYGARSRVRWWTFPPRSAICPRPVEDSSALRRPSPVPNSKARSDHELEGTFRLQVLVRDNNVDQALKALKKKMQREGIFREMKLRGHYEKPSEKKAREKAEAIRRARKLARKRAQREGLLPGKPKPVMGGPGGRPGGPGGPGGAASGWRLRRRWRWRRVQPRPALTARSGSICVAARGISRAVSLFDAMLVRDDREPSTSLSATARAALILGAAAARRLRAPASAPSVSQDPDPPGRDSPANIASLTEVVQRNPNDAQAYNVRGTVLGRAGRNQEALADFNRAIELDAELRAGLRQPRPGASPDEPARSRARRLQQGARDRSELCAAYLGRGRSIAQQGQRARRAQRLQPRDPDHARATGRPITIAACSIRRRASTSSRSTISPPRSA